MANLDKIVCQWNYGTGAPGFTTFFVSASQGPAIQPRLVTFWAAIAPYLPTAFSVVTPNSGETLDEASGKMVATWSGGTQTTTTGTAAAAWASVAGAMIRWTTGGFRNGRKVVGRTFIVPITSSSYSSGTIGATTANAIQAAAQALWSTVPGQLVVYARPVYDHSVKPPVLTRSGLSYAVNGSACPTKVTYLKSRRD